MRMQQYHSGKIITAVMKDPILVFFCAFVLANAGTVRFQTRNDHKVHSDPKLAPKICAASNSDGVLVAHEHCNQFYQCWDGKPLARQCYGDLQYNPLPDICVWPQNVDCGSRLIPESHKGQEGQDSGEENESNNTGNGNPSEAPSICAAENSNGVLVAHEKCNQFYQCNHGKPVAFTCPSNLLYNPYTENCNWPNNVECGDRTLPDSSENTGNGGDNEDSGNENTETSDSGSVDTGNSATDNGSSENNDSSENTGNGGDNEDSGNENTETGDSGSVDTGNSATDNGSSENNDSSENTGNGGDNEDSGNENIETGDSGSVDTGNSGTDNGSSDNNDSSENTGNGGDNEDSGNENTETGDSGSVDTGNSGIDNGSSENNVSGETDNGNVEEDFDIKEYCSLSGSNYKVLPHENCNQYYICIGGEPFINTCSGQFLFNPSMGLCDWPQNVNCENQGAGGAAENGESGGNNGGDSENDSNSDQSEQQSSEGEAVTNESNAVATCSLSGSNNIVMPHDNCKQYYICVNGVPEVLSCSGQFLFNANALLCDWPQIVDCGDRAL